MPKFIRSLAAALALGLAFVATAAPSSATLNPVISMVTGSPIGVPGIGHAVRGYITLGATDTYVTGGFTLTPQMLGGQVAIQSLITNGASASLETSSSVIGGVANVQLTQQQSGVGNIAATTSTTTVNLSGTFTGNSLSGTAPVICSLSNNALGGGSGTWPLTTAVSVCQYTGPGQISVSSTVAAPTGGGNFTYFCPTIYQQVPAGTVVASLVIQFEATVL